LRTARKREQGLLPYTLAFFATSHNIENMKRVFTGIQLRGLQGFDWGAKLNAEIDTLLDQFEDQVAVVVYECGNQSRTLRDWREREVAPHLYLRGYDTRVEFDVSDELAQITQPRY
jgi:hypothetical protein